MLEKILPYESNLFFLINGSHTPFLDSVMWLFSSIAIWTPLAIFFLIIIVYKKPWTEWLPVVITIVLLFVCCHLFSSTICKPYFARFRPTYYPGIEESVRTLFGYVGEQYGFISGHATNTFGFATLTTMLFGNRIYGIVIYLWAFIVAYSRIYMGVHFVSDIVAGAISGVLIAVLIFVLYRMYVERVNKGTVGLAYSNKQVKGLTAATILYILFFILLRDSFVLFFN